MNLNLNSLLQGGSQVQHVIIKRSPEKSGTKYNHYMKITPQKKLNDLKVLPFAKILVEEKLLLRLIYWQSMALSLYGREIIKWPTFTIDSEVC